MKRILALGVFAFVLGGGSALAICQFDECPQSERYWRNGDYGVFPNNNGSLSMTLYDGGTPVATSLTDLDSSEMGGFTLRSVSDTTAELYDYGQFVMTVDANNEASIQAFSVYVQGARPNGWWDRFKEWAQSGASQACNNATAMTAGWAAFAIYWGAQGNVPGVVSSLYGFHGARANQLQVCLG